MNRQRLSYACFALIALAVVAIVLWRRLRVIEESEDARVSPVLIDRRDPLEEEVETWLQSHVNNGA